MSATIYTNNYLTGISLYNPTTQFPATIASGVTIANNSATNGGDAVYGNNAAAWSLTNLGTLTSNAASGAGVSLADGGTVANSGATARIAGYAEGVYVNGAAGTVRNAGTIESTAANGSGIELAAGGRVTNSGTAALIEGVYNGIFGESGVAAVANTGTIEAIGGSGYGIYFRGGGTVTNGSAAATGALVEGVVEGVIANNDAAKIVNFGAIEGATGVDLRAGGTVIDSGAITGTSGIAVEFDGTGANLLSLAPGYVLTGDAVGSTGAGATNAIELTSAKTIGTISGIGSKFTNFQTVTVEIGADWLLAGANTIAAGVSLDSLGTLRNSGTLTVSGTVSASGSVVNTGSISGAVTLAGGAHLSNAKTGAITTAGTAAIYGIGGPVTATNAGTIESTLATGSGIELKPGGRVTNSGTAALIEGVLDGIYNKSGAAAVANTGTIEATAALGYGIYLRGGGTVTNGSATARSALIEGGKVGVDATDVVAKVVNFGTIEGGVGIYLNDGAVIDSGMITGTGGTAIAFSGSGVLVVEAGAVFNGAIVGSSGNDTFEFAATGLTASDTISGGTGTDTLRFTTAGTIAAGVFAHVTGIDTIRLANGTNSLTLSRAMVAASDHKKVTVEGGTGDDTIHGGALTAGDTLVFSGDGGNDAIVGGAGDNRYEFADKAGTLTIGNSFAGGTAAHGTLAFGTGRGDEDLWFLRSGNNLVAEVLGTSEKVTLDGWYGSNTSAQVKEITAGGLKLDSGLAALVQAMATFQADNPAFNPTAAHTAMPGDATLQNAIAAAWHS